MKQALLILFILLWFINSPVLQAIYDTTVYYGYIDFVAARFRVYEFMFLTLAIVCYTSGRGLVKSLSCFSVIIITGDLVDKICFGVTGYVLADISLIILAIVVSVIVYRNERRFKLDREPSKLAR